MNNCPKCGNPLQPGIVSCPICGTNLEQVKTETPVAKQNINTSTQKVEPKVKEQVVKPAQPVQGNSATETKRIAPKPAPQPIQKQANTGPVQPTGQPKPTAASSNPQPVQTNVAPKPVNQAQTVPTQNSVAQPKPVEVAPAKPSEVSSSSAQVATPIVEQKPAQPSTTVAPVKEVSQTPEVSPQPVSTPVEPVSAPAEPTSASVEGSIPVAPVVAKVEQEGPVPSIPSSLNNSNTSLNASNLKVEAPKEEKKVIKLSKKNLIIIAVAALIVIVGIVIYPNLGKKTSLKPNNNNDNNQNTEVSSISYAAGYKFNLPEEWSIIEDGKNVILKNNDETITLKFENISDSLESLTEEKIKKYLESLTSTENINILSTQISGKEAYLVNATINNLPVQIYLINSGARLITGATIIYQNEDIKTSSDAKITELLGTLSYSDESVKAIGTLNMYSNIFNVYKGIINYQEPIISDNNLGNNDENNIVDNNENNIDQPVQGETESNGENSVEPTPDRPGTETN